MKKVLTVLILFSLSLIAHAADSVIKRYHVTLKINSNAEMIVTETITINTANSDIKHGIYRDLPTLYRTPQGYNFDIGYRLLSVKRDDTSEPYHVEKMSNGVRIYIGDVRIWLDSGTHTYQIIYSINRALGFFETHDELYWNVTGNAWKFPIEAVTAIVELPPELKANKAIAYTGLQGAQGNNYEISYPERNVVVFNTISPLPPNNGLSIVVAWPKGLIKAPGFIDKLHYFIADNRPMIFSIGGYLFLIFFYGLCWFYVGRDPEQKTVIPLFTPPHGFSPEALRYIKQMEYDNQIFTTAIINMAVKKHLTITEEGKGNYSLRKISDDTSQLTPAEKVISEELFRTLPVLALEQENHEQLSKAIDSFKDELEKEYRSKYFVLNTPVITLGFIIILVSLLPIVTDYFDPIFGFIILGFCSYAGCRILLKSFSVYNSEKFNLGKTFGLALGLAAGVCIGFIIYSLSIDTGYKLNILMIILFFSTQAVFVHLMKRPTLLGANIVRDICGFELFLKATEEDRMNFRNPPDKTPELFEKYLPYALALGLEQKWSEQFATVLANVQYKPSWYSGYSYPRLSVSSLAHSIGSSLNSAISSASVAPGSSSGLGGGGFSGGGGGGGGGGGW